MTTAPNEIEYDKNNQRLICRGDFNLANLPHLQALLTQISIQTKKLIIDGSDVKKMDTAGAWFLNDYQKQLAAKHIEADVENFSKEQKKLLDIIDKELAEEITLKEPKTPNFLAQVGKNSIEQMIELGNYLAFIGKLSLETLRIATQPYRIRWNATLAIIYSSGYLALPIIALLSFMIGVVITYQMGLQLRNYGANIYIVDLLGLAVLREFGPLLTAIMVAGRTGSAFTAELGMMKLNQEIDALDTMGVTPAELLLLPRIFGLLVALPLLTMWADIFGILGGMVMSNNMLNITWYDFIQRFPRVIPLKTLLIGLGKAPIFALLIASIGCYQGIRVGGGADSVGRNTTRSVVLAIFFIMVADAAFSVLFSKLKL